jgi:ABC-type multidrug transport system ATPase subunit
MIDRSADSVVSLRGLHKSFGQIQAVDNLSLNVHKGDVYGFLGPNGSGKSTTLRMMLNLIKPDSGEVLLFGERLTTRSRKALSKVGSLIERPDFYNYISAMRNLELMAGYSGIRTDRKHLNALFETVGLAGRERSKVKTYSQGMKQRLGIAQALLHNPELIVLDEPVNGLDPQGIRDMRELMLRLNREQGKTLIVSSHILREMELIANRMVVISKGKVVAEGEVQTLINQSSHTLSLLTNRPDEVVVLLKNRFPHLPLLLLPNGEIELKAPSKEAPALSRIIVESGFELHKLNSRNSLEDYFLQVT